MTTTRPGAQTRGHAVSVLHVEDSSSDALLIRAELEDPSAEQRLDLTAAERLGEALELLRARSFDAVLLDLNLPDSRGVETLERLREEAPELPVIVLTGMDDDELALAALRFGAQDYVPKDRADGWTLRHALRHAIERQRLLAETRRLGEQLQRAQKMEAVGRLAGGVAHDFNNLLTVISGCTSLLLAQEPDDPDMAQLLREIDGAGQRAAALTRQLLDFARHPSRAPEADPIDVNSVVRALESLLLRLLGPGLELRADYEPDLCPVRIDPTRLEQVVMNLAVNARDAMPQGGELRFATERFTDEGGDPWVRLTVSDTGTGMDARTREHLFEPFFTTKPAGRGTGLGLATVFSVVDQAGGQVDVQSAPGHGTRFLVELPCQPGDRRSQPGAGATAAPPDASSGGETLLLVDDEQSVREFTRMALESAGYRVLTAPDAAAGLERLEADPTVALLVTDVMLPGMSGPRLAEAARARRPGLQVLYLSGYSAETMERRGMLGPGAALLEKPFSALALRRRVRAVLDAAR